MRGLGHRVGADRALALAARVVVAGDQGPEGAACARHPRTGLSARRLAAVAPRSSDRARDRRARAARGRPPRRRRLRSRPATGRPPSDLLCARARHFGRDPIYEESSVAAATRPQPAPEQRHDLVVEQAVRRDERAVRTRGSPVNVEHAAAGFLDDDLDRARSPTSACTGRRPRRRPRPRRPGSAARSRRARGSTTRAARSSASRPACRRADVVETARSSSRATAETRHGSPSGERALAARRPPAPAERRSRHEPERRPRPRARARAASPRPARRARSSSSRRSDRRSTSRRRRRRRTPRRALLRRGRTLRRARGSPPRQRGRPPRPASGRASSRRAGRAPGTVRA